MLISKLRQAITTFGVNIRILAGIDLIATFPRRRKSSPLGTNGACLLTRGCFFIGLYDNYSAKLGSVLPQICNIAFKRHTDPFNLDYLNIQSHLAMDTEYAYILSIRYLYADRFPSIRASAAAYNIDHTNLSPRRHDQQNHVDSYQEQLPFPIQEILLV